MFRGMFGPCAIWASWMSGVLCGATVFVEGLGCVCLQVEQLCVQGCWSRVCGAVLYIWEVVGAVVGEDGCPSGEMKS